MVRADHLQSLETLNLSRSDGREARQVMGQTANDVDQLKRLSSLDLISTDYRLLCIV